ncbi:MAG: phosphoribosylformylglycinamidine cyclo-ligase [Chloroflexi bacterium]|nr:phosphoribosylformylglycinamidine cyclo-ligase [Chloroflexota bacterium]
MSYAAAGVDTGAEETGLANVARWVTRTFAHRPGSVRLPLGYFANVLDLGQGIGLAISTDGVGTKLLVAQMLDRYDTVGIDCVAMNANDVLCVGAEPIAMVDCIAVESADPAFLDQIAQGLYEGARQANITIPGGEIAQIREMVRGIRAGRAFDLVGTCVGTVPLDRIIIGEQIEPGDVVVGIASSGIHSNGLTLARDVLFARGRLRPDEVVADLGRTVGEELLEPTRIYVSGVVQMLREGLGVRALAHVTSDGLLNLTRVAAPVGYVVEALPEPPAIFALLQRLGGISDEEMFQVFNMGVGFCVVVAPADAPRAIAIARARGWAAQPIGYAVADEARRVRLPGRRLVGQGDRFVRAG